MNESVETVTNKDRYGEKDSFDILLVEDNRINQAVVTRILRKRNHKITIAGNGIEALKELESKEFDVVLMDIQMPKMDGIEATRQIRSPDSMVRNHSVPIIALTAHAIDQQKEKCLRVGMNTFLLKPIKAMELEKTIYEVIMGRENHLESRPIKTRSKSFDRTQALENVDMDEELYIEFSNIFLQEIGGVMERLKALTWKKKEKKLESVAHSLRSSTGSIGAYKLAELAEEIEILSKKGGVMDYITILVKQFEVELKKVIEELEKFNREYSKRVEKTNVFCR